MYSIREVLEDGGVADDLIVCGLAKTKDLLRKLKLKRIERSEVVAEDLLTQVGIVHCIELAIEHGQGSAFHLTVSVAACLLVKRLVV